MQMQNEVLTNSGSSSTLAWAAVLCMKLVVIPYDEWKHETIQLGTHPKFHKVKTSPKRNSAIHISLSYHWNWSNFIGNSHTEPVPKFNTLY